MDVCMGRIMNTGPVPVVRRPSYVGLSAGRQAERESERASETGRAGGEREH